MVDSTVGSSGVIAAHDTFDANVSMRLPVSGLTLNFGIDNLLNKAPPRPVNAGPFNTFPDTYNVIGRTYGLSLSLKR